MSTGVVRRYVRCLASLFISVVCVSASVTLAGPVQERGTLRLQPPKHARFEFGGILGQRIDANVRQWLVIAPDANPGLTEMFRTRDRKPEPDLVPWAGEFVGKYLLSAIQAQRMIQSAELDRTVRRVVDELIAAQADDGYIGPFRKNERLLAYWDLWGHYHIMLALMMDYEDNNYQPSLDATIRAADLICRIYLDGNRRVMDAGSPETNMAVIHALGRLYRTTGNPRYQQMMQHIEKDWERAGDYTRTGLANVLFFRTPKPRWESLHAIQGLVELFRITGQSDYRTAFVNLWGSIARYDRHNSGSFSTGEGAIGNPYRPGAIETCCTTAWAALTVDMLQLTGEAAVADELEWTTYNAVLASQHPTGRWWTYDTPMDGRRLASAHSIVFQCRPGTPELNCCSVNGPRGLGMLSDWAVLLDDDGVVLNHYGPCKITFDRKANQPLTLIQDSGYPSDNKARIRLMMDSPAEFTLKLRIPHWSKHTSVTVNGQAVADVKAGSYLPIKRTWQSGDTIDLVLDMTPWHWTGECEVAGKASLYRGPILLTYDQHHNAYDADQIPVLDLNNVRLAPATTSDRFPPIVLFDAIAADNRVVRLCDFATAGAHGNEYRSWLPAKNGRPVAECLKYAFMRVTDTFETGPDGMLAASALDGNGEPSPGKLAEAINITPAVDRNGRANGAVAFNGTNAKILYDISGFPQENYSLSAWFRVDAFSRKLHQQIFSAWAGTMDDRLRITLTGEQLSARIEAGATYATPGVKIEAKRWYHVAVIKSGSKLSLYLNGELKQTIDAPVCYCAPAHRIALGGNPNSPGDEYFHGSIDDFVFSTKALSAEEIKKNFETSKPRSE